MEKTKKIKVKRTQRVNAVPKPQNDNTEALRKAAGERDRLLDELKPEPEKNPEPQVKPKYPTKFSRIRKKLKKGEPGPNCYIADATQRPAVYAFELLDLNDIPVESREREYKGYLVHFLSRDKNGVLHAVEAPVTNEASPASVHAALNPPGMFEIFGISPTNWAKAKTILLAVVIGIELIVAFLIKGGNLGGFL